MAVTAAQVKAVATELTAILDATIDGFIAMAERRTNRTNWGAKADDGVIFLAAHLTTMQAKAASAGVNGNAVKGPLTSETVGPLSRSFDAGGSGSAPWSDAWLSGSPWGIAYVELRALVMSDRCL